MVCISVVFPNLVWHVFRVTTIKLQNNNYFITETVFILKAILLSENGLAFICTVLKPSGALAAGPIEKASYTGALLGCYGDIES